MYELKHLERFSSQELKKICKRNGIKGYSKLSKNELVNFVNEKQNTMADFECTLRRYKTMHEVLNEMQGEA